MNNNEIGQNEEDCPIIEMKYPQVGVPQIDTPNNESDTLSCETECESCGR
jgi:hypothetical protein